MLETWWLTFWTGCNIEYAMLRWFIFVKFTVIGYNKLITKHFRIWSFFSHPFIALFRLLSLCLVLKSTSSPGVLSIVNPG